MFHNYYLFYIMAPLGLKKRHIHQRRPHLNAFSCQYRIFWPLMSSCPDPPSLMVSLFFRERFSLRLSSSIILSSKPMSSMVSDWLVGPPENHSGSSSAYESFLLLSLNTRLSVKSLYTRERGSCQRGKSELCVLEIKYSRK